MDFCGKALIPRQLCRRVGKSKQMAGIEPFVLGEGSAQGCESQRETEVNFRGTTVGSGRES